MKEIIEKLKIAASVIIEKLKIAASVIIVMMHSIDFSPEDELNILRGFYFILLLITLLFIRSSKIRLLFSTLMGVSWYIMLYIKTIPWLTVYILVVELIIIIVNSSTIGFSSYQAAYFTYVKFGIGRVICLIPLTLLFMWFFFIFTIFPLCFYEFNPHPIAYIAKYYYITIVVYLKISFASKTAPVPVVIQVITSLKFLSLCFFTILILFVLWRISVTFAYIVVCGESFSPVTFNEYIEHFRSHGRDKLKKDLKKLKEFLGFK